MPTRNDDGYLLFLVTSDFAANVLENWQSEWLQFGSSPSPQLASRRDRTNRSPRATRGSRLTSSNVSDVSRGGDSPRWAKVTLAAQCLRELLRDRDGRCLLATWLGQSFRPGRSTTTTGSHHERRISEPLRGLSNFWERKPPELASEFLRSGLWSSHDLLVSAARRSPASRCTSQETGSSAEVSCLRGWGRPRGTHSRRRGLNSGFTRPRAFSLTRVQREGRHVRPHVVLSSDS